MGNANPVPTFDTITVPQYSQPYTVQWSSQRIAGSYGHSTLLSPTAGDLCSVAAPSITGGWPATAVDVISTITLPNGTFYKFTYDPTFGLIKRITYPNGGYVEYDWAMQPYFDQGAFSITVPSYVQLGGPIYDSSFMGQPLPYYVNCMYAYDWPAVIARRVSFDGTTVAQSQTFSYSPSPLTVGGGERTTTVSTINAANSPTTSTSTTLYKYDIQQADSNDPLGFVPAYGQFVYSPPYIGPVIAQITSTYPQTPANNPLEDSIVYEDGAGNVLKTVSKTWFNVQSDIEASETVTLEPSGPSTTTSYQHAWPGQTTQTAVTNYDGSQQVTNVAYHPFCPLLGTTSLGQCIATSQAIFDRPDAVTVTASAASNSPALAETDYGSYDQNGNVQTITKRCYSSGGACASESQTLRYDPNGQVISMSDGRGSTTTYDYTDNYSSGGTSSSQTDAYPTKITFPTVNGVTQVQKFAYNYASGRLNWAQDANQQTTSYIYNDSLGRVTEIDYPDRGKTTVNYSDAGSSPTVTVSKLDGGTSVSVRDGMGHVVQSQQVATGLPTVYAETTYDGAGNVASVTNPHFEAPSASDGVTSFAYDALGRKLLQCQPDNGGSPIPCQPGSSYLAWSYPANVTTFQDEAHNAWSRTTDAFGRLTQVIEPGALQTIYGYDGLGNLGTVTQSGRGGESPRIRSFTYDSLSRLVTSGNPETGTICYGLWSGGSCRGGYDANGNLSAKTDARGVTTSYTYDALNRLTYKSYSDATQPGRFGYDGFDPNGVNLASAGIQTLNPVGRLTQASTNNAGTIWSYDAMGRIGQQFSYLPSLGNYSTGVSAAYDLAGNMTDLIYPDGRHIHQTWNGAGQLGQPGQPAVADANSAQQFVETVTYNADSSPSSTTFGNGVQQTVAKNNRLQVQSMTASTPLMPFSGQSFLSHTYSYINPTNPQMGNNGNIWGVVDTLNGSRSQSFTYDALNRISSFSLGGVLNQQFQIDSFGNMSQNLGVNWLSCFDPANNRLNDGCYRTPVGPSPGPAPPALAYDNAGNLTGDTDSFGMPRTYTYDGESRISSIALSGNTALETYTYNAEGNRVRKFSPGDGLFTEYVNFNGQPIAERDQAGNWTDYIYANGQKIAKVPQVEKVLTISGYNNGNGDYNWYPVNGNGGLGNYVVGSGDKLVVRQRQHGSAIGGVHFDTVGSGGVGYGLGSDEDGQPASDDATGAEIWHQRTFDLSPQAGTTLGQLYVGAPQGSGAGSWSIDFTDMMLYNAASASWVQIQTEAHPVSLSYWAGSFYGGWTTNATWTVAPVQAAAATSTRYYVGDHLGTAQVEFGSGGWPIWQGQFAPFGGELVNGTPLAPTLPDGSSSHYKFTGKERDSESGLDYFGARYYGSNMGRFMSPDWSEDPDPVPYADIGDPQSLNLYSYVGNNPLRRVDPTGHDGNPVLDAIEATSMAAVDAGIGYLATATTFTVSTVLAPVVAVGGMLLYTPSLGDPAETRYLRMQAQHGKNRVIPTNYENLTDEQLQEAYDKEKNPVVKEQLKKALKDRELKKSRQQNNKKPAATKLKMDPASVRARQQANPIPAPTPPAPDPPKPPKDDHGDHP